jgi:hypothetical protein
MANSDLKLRTKDYSLSVIRLLGSIVDWGQIFTIDIVLPGMLEEQYGTTVKDFVFRCSLSCDVPWE